MATTTYSAPTVSVAAIGGRTDSVGEAVADYTAEEARMLTEILNAGYLRPAEAWQVTAQAAPNMSVKVGSGSAKADHYVVEGKVAGQGKYIVRLDVTSVNLTVPAADVSQTRTDQVYLVVLDNSYDATLRGIPQLGYRKGDLGGAAPGPDDAWEAYALLATITVGPGVTEITNNEIVDERSAATLVESLLAVDTSNLVTKDLINAKGDLYVGTGNDAVGRLGVGSDGQVLTADSSQVAGVKWGALPEGVTVSAASDTVTSGGETTSNTFTDLPSPGPAVTVDVGAKGIAIVTLSAYIDNGYQESGDFWQGAMSFEATGANSVSADVSRCLRTQPWLETDDQSGDLRIATQCGTSFVLTGLTPGSTTFTAKYSSQGTTSTVFSNRTIGVVSF